MATAAKVRRPHEQQAAEPEVQMFPTGCALLDLQQGGGWVLGRCVNVVGDSSTGKTGLFVDAAANFARLYGPHAVRYVETESAFSTAYAEQLGLPRGIQRTERVRTVEEFNDDLSDYLKRLDSPAGLYCVDSIDALSSDAEASRDISDKSTYATEKAKVLGEVFRRQIVDIARRNVCLFLISQTRDNIGNPWLPKTRSGGRALDFYSSQTVWLSEIGKVKRTVSGVERIVGVDVRVANRKNKVGEPYRTVDIQIIFSYGIDDEISCIAWLKKNRADESALLQPLDGYERAVRRAREKHALDDLLKYSGDLRAATKARWNEIEKALKPPVRKYEVI